ncbi:gluconokinase [Hamadaea tsunoensis]|uniref:gluconokinase n=1 Tax=Hamadaea tsunoensis TaxID=53368 RepID=UPI0004089D30|nr:gluconokinase [Hamadaea tsunoensis]
MTAPHIIVLLGVAGSGKTTVGKALAQKLGTAFVDGDDLHPVANVRKMAQGIALTDDDRRPWLARIASWMDAELAAGKSGVVACSGLRRAYRDELRDGRRTLLVYLHLDRAVAHSRVAARVGHFFTEKLLDSQFATLEEPAPEEDVLTVDARLPVDDLVAEIAARSVRME